MPGITPYLSVPTLTVLHPYLESTGSYRVMGMVYGGKGLGTGNTPTPIHDTPTLVLHP